jgi:hypothetical protein
MLTHASNVSVKPNVVQIGLLCANLKFILLTGVFHCKQLFLAEIGVRVNYQLAIHAIN